MSDHLNLLQKHVRKTSGSVAKIGCQSYKWGYYAPGSIIFMSDPSTGHSKQHASSVSWHSNGCSRDRRRYLYFLAENSKYRYPYSHVSLLSVQVPVHKDIIGFITGTRPKGTTNTSTGTSTLVPKTIKNTDTCTHLCYSIYYGYPPVLHHTPNLHCQCDKMRDGCGDVGFLE